LHTTPLGDTADRASVAGLVRQDELAERGRIGHDLAVQADDHVTLADASPAGRPSGYDIEHEGAALYRQSELEGQAGVDVLRRDTEIRDWGRRGGCRRG